MQFKSLFIVGFLLAFSLQSVAEAASISTRVRILESKVAKQDKAMQQAIKSQQSSEAQVAKSLSKMKALEKKVDKLLKDKQQAAKSDSKMDKRYAFP